MDMDFKTNDPVVIIGKVIGMYDSGVLLVELSNGDIVDISESECHKLLKEP